MTRMPEVHDALQAAIVRRSTKRRRRSRLALAATAVLAMGGGAAIAATSWSPVIGDDERGHPRVATEPIPGEQTGVLGVLRRPQTAADRGPEVERVLAVLASRAIEGVQLNGVRLLDRRADGVTVLIPVERSGVKDPGYPSSVQRQALCLFYETPAGVGEKCGSTDDLQRGTIRGRTADGKTVRLFGLVPDGVRHVSVQTRDGHTLSTQVTGNAYEISAERAAIGDADVTWSAANGADLTPRAG